MPHTSRNNYKHKLERLEGGSIFRAKPKEKCETLIQDTLSATQAEIAQLGDLIYQLSGPAHTLIRALSTTSTGATHRHYVTEHEEDSHLDVLPTGLVVNRLRSLLEDASERIEFLHDQLLLTTEEIRRLTAVEVATYRDIVELQRIRRELFIVGPNMTPDEDALVTDSDQYNRHTDIIHGTLQREGNRMYRIGPKQQDSENDDDDVQSNEDTPEMQVEGV